MVDGWFGMTVATVFVLTTALCAVSLAAHGPRRGGRIAAAEANHIVMGVAMVLMVTPVTARLVAPLAGAVVFGLGTAAWLWALVVARRRDEPLGSAVGVDRCTAHPAHLAVVDAAMVVMYLAMAPAGRPAVGLERAGRADAGDGHDGAGGARDGARRARRPAGRPAGRRGDARALPRGPRGRDRGRRRPACARDPRAGAGRTGRRDPRRRRARPALRRPSRGRCRCSPTARCSSSARRAWASRWP